MILGPSPFDSLGATVSGLHLGMGVLFTRHVILDAQQVGALPAGVAIKTRETYRSGQLYIAVAVVGRPPFIQKDR